MLSAFTARPIVELKPRDKSKIESILAYGDRLLVGLNTGVLRVYRVNEPENGAEREEEGDQQTVSSPDKKAGGATDGAERPSSQKITELLREQEKFSRYKIEQ